MMLGRRLQPSSGCHVGNKGETRLYVDGEVSWMDRYVITASLKEKFWDAQPVKGTSD